jgi:2'-5' RNA ligase
VERPSKIVVNEDRTRSFIAIEIPKKTKRELIALARSLRKGGIRASWLREPALHLSLRFLGDITTDERAAIESGLDEVCARTAPFALMVEGVGVFPNPRAPRVLWAGVSGDVDALQSLAEAVEDLARSAGLEPVRKRFNPHITLARFRNPIANEALNDVLHEHAAFDGGAIPVDRVSLFKSELRPEGANHTILRSFSLGTHD